MNTRMGGKHVRNHLPTRSHLSDSDVVANGGLKAPWWCWGWPIGLVMRCCSTVCVNKDARQGARDCRHSNYSKFRVSTKSAATVARSGQEQQKQQQRHEQRDWLVATSRSHIYTIRTYTMSKWNRATNVICRNILLAFSPAFRFIQEAALVSRKNGALGMPFFLYVTACLFRY